MRYWLGIGLICLVSVLLGCSGNTDKKSGGDEPSDYAYVTQLKQDVLDRYKDLALLMGEQQAREETVKWVAEQGRVEKTGISEDGKTIWIILKTGVELDIVTE